jgi:hypothetical protein
MPLVKRNGNLAIFSEGSDIEFRVSCRRALISAAFPMHARFVESHRATRSVGCRETSAAPGPGGKGPFAEGRIRPKAVDDES